MPGKEHWKESTMGDMPDGVIHTEVKADLFKSMGHPARILVLEMLASGPVTVSSLRDGTGLEASNLSQHLGILRRQRLIVPSRKDGRLFYELTSPEVREVLDAARGLLGAILDGGLRQNGGSDAALATAPAPSLTSAAQAGG
jgi:ArsR family transcriptional regulator